MKTKQHRRQFTLLACLVTIQTSGFVSANAERELLIKVSAEKMDAIIIANNGDTGTCGCFIGEDGLAVFHLLTFAKPKAPDSYSLGNGDQLKPPALRWFSAELGIAIVKFDYRPKVVIEPGAEVLAVGTQVAILDPQLGGPVAIGPVTQITREIVANCLRLEYSPQFSVGAGLPAGGKNLVAPGSPIIDSEGKLRGIYSNSRNLRTQTLLNGVATDQWFAGIEAARTAKAGMPIPLPPELNPYDPASDHPDYRSAAIAASRGEFAEGIKHVRNALKAHPESPMLHSLHFDIAIAAGMNDELLALAEARKPPAGASDAEQVAYHASLAKALGRIGDQAGAGEALRKGLEIAPKEEHGFREEYSSWLEREGRFDEALRYIREASEATPANILFLKRQQRLLIQLKRWDEEAKVSERIDELEELYRPTSSIDLRPRKR